MVCAALWTGRWSEAQEHPDLTNRRRTGRKTRRELNGLSYGGMQSPRGAREACIPFYEAAGTQEYVAAADHTRRKPALQAGSRGELICTATKGAGLLNRNFFETLPTWVIVENRPLHSQPRSISSMVLVWDFCNLGALQVARYSFSI